MEDLTFGEQVKIILGRKGMTIKQLAELIEVRTGKKMSRQNLTQRLGRDNFQEQDMRMIAEILECPFRLSIMGVEAQTIQKSKPAEQKTPAYSYHVDAQPEQEEMKPAESGAQPEQSAAEVMQPAAEPVYSEAEPAQTEAEALQQEAGAQVQPDPAEAKAEENSTGAGNAESTGADERDMTIGELYDIHRELNEMEESIKAGETAEKAEEEAAKKKKSRFSPGIFLRRKRAEEPEENIDTAEADSARDTAETSEESWAKPAEDSQVSETSEEYTAHQETEEPEDFEPVIARDDSDEDTVIGEVNPYTGREYQSNSVRMHPTRIGYVQVYDRSIHKWTDMTEWAFLGYQERKKTLLGKAYEPPIYLD